MDSNKFATKLDRSIRKIVKILVYAVLEWVLIALLLFNSLLYYFIKKFASFFGLKPTCIWCSSVDCLFESGIKDGSFDGLFCKDHTSQISKIGYCLAHQKLVESQTRCGECSQSVDHTSGDGFVKEVSCSCSGKRFNSDLPHLMINGLLDVVAEETVRIEEMEEDQGNNVSTEEPHILSDVGSSYLQEAAEEDSSRTTSNSLCHENEGNDDDEEEACGVEVDVEVHNESKDASENDLQADQLMVKQEEEEKEINYAEIKIAEVGGNEVLIGNQESSNEVSYGHSDEKYDEETRSILGNGKEENQAHFSIERLILELETERKAHRDLSVELEAERNAAAIAANQTMAMITRLQEEKAAIKMEAVQYQRMMEEQAEYDQEALQLLNELVIKRETEKTELENELEMYQEKVLSYEMVKEKATSLRKNGCSLSSYSLNDDSEKLSIDLNCEIREDREHENKEMPSTGAVLDSVDMVLDRVKNWNMLDGSLEEFEEERLSILHQLQELEEKLFRVCDDDQEEEQEADDKNSSLCSTEKDHPNTMAWAAKKMLPFLEKEDGDGKQVEVDATDKVSAVMKEMNHVYGRLQALEADREFLRHCIGSLNKGDKGVGLLEEILQHLRELRSSDSCELMICNE